MEADDSTLLRQFAEERSEEAFAALVHRNLPLVYSAAVRRLNGDVHRASDVAQTVFVALARDARRLSRHPALTGWLYAATRSAAIDVIRAENRRRRREREAHDMTANSSGTPEWQQLRPLIDDALDALPEHDRRVLLRRFFQAQRFSDIGREFSISEEAARKRADRALEVLRRQLSRRGITSTAAGLATVLEAGAVEAAPAGLAGSVIAAATAAPATAVTLGFMMLTKAHLAGLAAAFAIGGSALLWQHHEIAELEIANAAAERRLKQARAQAAAETKQLRAELSEARTVKTSVSNPASRPDVVATLKQAVAAARASVTLDPQQLVELHTRYDPFLKQRGLTPEQSERWISLMAEKDNLRKDLQDAVRQYGATGNSAEVQAIQTELQREYWKQMNDILGPEGQHAFAEYEQLSFFRLLAGPFTSELAAAGAPLSDAQSEQLVRTIIANHSTVRGDRTDVGTRSVVNWIGVAQQSAAFLTPAQQAVMARVAPQIRNQ